jgi:hypothetical protein
MCASTSGAKGREIVAAGGQEIDYPKLALPLMGMQRSMREDALQIARKYSSSAQQPSMVEAAAVRDAVMVLTAYGEISLATRKMVLMTVKSSQHAATPCTYDSCLSTALSGGRSRKPGSTCYGNRFESFQTSEGQPSWQLVVAHAKGDRGAVLGIWSAETKELLAFYELRCRPVLIGIMVGAAPLTMFVDDDGQPYHGTSMDKWWRNVLK